MEVILVASVSKFIERRRYWCVQANMGYSQSDRWHFDPAAGNCDCSSLVIHCLREAGFDTGSANTTRDLSANLTARGWARVSNDGNPYPGDILLNDANHVAVYIGGGLIAQASVSETGGIAGAPGDQTGGETNVNNYYNFPWNCYLRWTGNNDLQGEIDMPVKTDPINWDGMNTTVEYALQDIKHKLDALGNAQNISDKIWFGPGNGVLEETPLYALREIRNSVNSKLK